METLVMTGVSSEHMGFLEWAAFSRTHPHELLCGDAFLVKRTSQGVLLSVIDGLGHGPEAAEAAEAAMGAISEYEEDRAEEILAHCHQVLKATRGAVLSLAMLDQVHNNLSWIGIGNVEGLLVRVSGQHDWLPLRPGIVGCRMPNLRASELAVVPGDLLVMFSDGVATHGFDLLSADQSPVEMAERIIAEQARGTDDAIVLVARYHGSDELMG